MKIQSAASIHASEPPSANRSLKIEAEGDPWKGLIKPKIRLIGRWLQSAGFKPGQRVRVVCVADGVLELRSIANTEQTQPTAA